MLHVIFFLLTKMIWIMNYSKHKCNIINDLMLRESRPHYSDMDDYGLMDDHQQDQEEEDGGDEDDPYTSGNE